MPKPGNGRRLLTSTARMATLVCVGVAETACNLQVSSFQHDASVRPDGGTTADGGHGVDAALDAHVESDANTDADVDGSSPTDGAVDANNDGAP